MTLGDGIRRNIASVDPSERALLLDAMVQLNSRRYPGNRTDQVPGGVTWWFKQDEIHQATHVHGGPEFLPWHRVIVNRFEELLRQIHPEVSLHYWDWTQDPRAIPNANLGNGTTGTLNLFTSGFMGWGGPVTAPIGAPWAGAGFYAPGAVPNRDSSDNPADPPSSVNRSVTGSPATQNQDDAVLTSGDYASMRNQLEQVHNAMHGFVNMGSQHISFRDPFVFLLHSNVDRLFARWQTEPGHGQRLAPATVYGPESADSRVNKNVEPWSTGHSFDQFGVEHFTRPWCAPENQGLALPYKDPQVVTPPRYDSNHRSGNGINDGRPFWVSDFTGDGKADVLFYFPGDDNWWLGSLVNGQLTWSHVGNTAGFGHGINDGRPFWVSDFTGDGKADVLFYFPGDDNWWLGSLVNGQLTWSHVGNTAGFGHGINDGRPFWVGDFTGDGKADVLFYFPGDDNWWLGSLVNGQLTWSHVGNTAGFGHGINDGRPFWVGDFTGDGKADVLFYFPGDDNWWLGSLVNGQLTWSHVGNTAGFGHGINDGRPFWVGDFTGDGKADVLFYFPGDDNWWLGSLVNGQLHLEPRRQHRAASGTASTTGGRSGSATSPATGRPTCCSTSPVTTTGGSAASSSRRPRRPSAPPSAPT